MPWADQRAATPWAWVAASFDRPASADSKWERPAPLPLSLDGPQLVGDVLSEELAVFASVEAHSNDLVAILVGQPYDAAGAEVWMLDVHIQDVSGNGVPVGGRRRRMGVLVGTIDPEGSPGL